MFFRILKKDLKRKKSMNFILFVFIVLATMFLSSSVNNLVAVLGAVDRFIEISNAPDIFTIALGGEGKDEIEEYISKNEYVTEYDVINSFNITNDRIKIIESASGSDRNYERTSMLFVHTDSDNFMKVFDLDGNRLDLAEGQIAVAKYEAEQNELQVGDRLEITVGEVTQEFRIATIIKDAVFGTEFMGCKRFIINQKDYERFTNQEGLIYTKMYCINSSDLKSFNKSVNEQNYKFISSVEKTLIPACYIFDMLMAAILIIVSVCLILIAFLVLRFTIVFTIQEDYKEIGIMKAIGIKQLTIKGIYMVKYLGISAVGAFVGFIAGILFGDMMLKQAIANIVIDKADKNIFINLFCAVAIVVIVMLFCYTCTGRLKKFSAIDAIRNGSTGERYCAKNYLKLWKCKLIKPTTYMAINDILSNAKSFVILGVTFCIGTMLILLPLSAANTLKSDGIVNLFGYLDTDTFIDKGNLDDYLAEEDYDELLADLEQIRQDIKDAGYNVKVGAELGFAAPCYSDNPDEKVTYFTMQLIGDLDSDYAIIKGSYPVLENEIMVTEITAKELGVNIGDSIYFEYSDGTKEFIVTGFYQSMLNMGNGFRLNENIAIDYADLASVITIQAEIDGIDSQEASEAIKKIYPEYKVYTGKEFVGNFIGGILEQIDAIMLFITVLVLMINALITALMMKTLITKEHADIALLKSTGFSNRSIRMWQVKRIMFILAMAIITGTILSKLLAPCTVGLVFVMMGANKIQLVTNPVQQYVIYPMILLVVTGIAASICTIGVKRVDLKEVNNME